MDTYLTGEIIKKAREKKGLTQNELASIVGVSDKAVSKWETAKGFPDISLWEPLADALSLSVTELLSGKAVVNNNQSCNIMRSKLYVCPICGNIIHSTGNISVSCCGISLTALEAETADDCHIAVGRQVEDECFITIDHDMTKEHYISFIAYVTSDRFWMTKLYPESNAETRFRFRGSGYLYIYCNRHGLMKQRISGANII